MNSKALLATGAGIAAAGAAAFGAYRNAQKESRLRRLPEGTRIVVLGAGFGGMTAASELARLLPEPRLGTITLVDERDYLLFTPMLTEIVGGELETRHAVAPANRLSPRVTFAKGRVDSIDIENRRVELDLRGSRRTIEADHLVIALGGSTNFRDTPGAEQHSLAVKTVEDALAIRNRALELVERAAVEPDPAVRRQMLTFIVAGGGYTGVETMAALNDLVRNAVRPYPRISRDEIRMLIVEPADRLMLELTPELAAFGTEKLRERGVEVMLRTKPTAAGPDWVELDGGRRIPCRTLVWTAGVEPNPLVAGLKCRHGRHGGIAAAPTCAVEGREGVWALGDCAEIPEPGGGFYAPTAQNATREGRHVARNIVRALAGEPARAFRYKPIGQLALVGRHSGVGRVYGFNFCGAPAWALWRAVYLLKMPTAGQRFRVGLDWLLDLAFGRDMVEVPYAPRAARDLASS